MTVRFRVFELLPSGKTAGMKSYTHLKSAQIEIKRLKRQYRVKNPSRINVYLTKVDNDRHIYTNKIV